MKNPLVSLRNWLLERDVNGQYWYTLGHDSWATSNVDNVKLAQNHPFLTPGLLFLSNLFAQGDFKVIRKSTGKEYANHWILNLLNDPNYYDTKIDLLESFQFLKIARGSVVLYLRRGSSIAKPNAIYVLDPGLITYPKGFKTPTSFRKRDDAIGSQQVIYDKDGENMKIKLDDLIYYHDLPAGYTKTRHQNDENDEDNNKLISYSRVDGIKQTLINTLDSHTAKNIILKTNGKEIISTDGGTNSMPLNEKEKNEAQSLFNNNYGLGRGRSRSWFTKANIRWQAAHVAMRDLGLDESTKVDANIVYTALHIPKDIISIEAKKTTYNNFKESMVSFIQNSIQSMMNDFTAGLNKQLIEEGYELVGTYNHLPVMQFIEIERNQALQGKLTAVQTMLSIGFDPSVALELAGLDPSITITPPENEETSQESEADKETNNYFALTS